MYKWYAINTYSGHENKVKQNLQHRLSSTNLEKVVRQIVIPTEQTVEVKKDNTKVNVEKRTMPGYILLNMQLDEDSWQVVSNTPGVTGFVGPGGEPLALSRDEVDKMLGTTSKTAAKTAQASKTIFEVGQVVRITEGPLADFSGEISSINEEANKLHVLVSIFGRETPTEVSFTSVVAEKS